METKATRGPWITVVAPDIADGRLAELFKTIVAARGRVAAVHAIQSLDPEALRLHLDLYLHLMFGRSPLPRRERELLGVTVSRANSCLYCIEHHTDALRAHEKRSHVVEAIREGRWGDLPARDAALGRFAERLTRVPGQSTEAHLAELRDVGLDDSAILAATEIVAYFNFVNRLVLGLGVGLEPDGGRSGFRY